MGVLRQLADHGMNGYEAAKSIRALERTDAKSVPIIAMEANEVILLGRQFGKTIERESARISEKYDLRLAELDILARIAGKKQGDTARDIIQCNRVSKAHISKCLDNLSAKGFIIIRADEKDHRLRRVELTEKARKAAREQIEVYNRCKAMIVTTFFPGNVWIAPLMYFTGIAIIVLSGIALKKTKYFGGEASPFVMELPAYHIPSFKGVLIHMWERARAFIIKAGTIIFTACVVIWFLSNFSWTMAAMSGICRDYDLAEPEIIQISVSRLNSKHNFEAQPVPWIITTRAVD